MTDKLVQDLRNMVEAQGRDGTWNYDPYMQGLYNGLEFALSIMEKREPQFREAPTQWLADIRVETKLSDAEST